MRKFNNYEDLFWADVQKRIFSVDSEGRIWKHSNRGFRCNPKRAEKGIIGHYQQVQINDFGKYRYVSAHRAVYRVLIGPIPEGMIINHKNGQKDDNRPSNLELSTYSDNQKHAHRTGLSNQYGERNPAAKLTDKQVAEIRLAYSSGGFTQKQLADKYGVKFQSISKIVRGDRREYQLGKTAHYEHRRTEVEMERNSSTGKFVGKKSSGRMLDDREWNEFPEVSKC